MYKTGFILFGAILLVIGTTSKYFRRYVCNTATENTEKGICLCLIKQNQRGLKPGLIALQNSLIGCLINLFQKRAQKKMQLSKRALMI